MHGNCKGVEGCYISLDSSMRHRLGEGGGMIFRPGLRDVSLLAGDDRQSSGECDATRTVLIKGAPSSGCH